MADKADKKEPDAEHKILCIVMGRETGHTKEMLPIPEAVALAREEMGKGKWLRTVNLEGQSNLIIRDVREIAQDDVAYGIFENVSELQMMGALQGG